MSKTVYISFTNKLWRVHTEDRDIGELYILKSIAIVVAVNYITSFPEGKYNEIKIQSLKKGYYTYWKLETDAFPPKKKPFRVA